MLTAPQVWNRRNPNTPRDAIYVGRPTIWGNPFQVGLDGTRDHVIELFEAWVLSDQPNLVERARRELRGKHLVCWCAPLRCHASFWLRVANV